MSVVEPRRAGMASGINNTFRQVGIATGIAGLGAIFQSKHTLIDGLNAILLVAAIVSFAGAILGLALVRDARPGQTTAAGWRGLKRIASCHAASIIITAAPVTTISACAATENATASAFGTPESTRSVAPAPACIAAPAGPIGTAAEAADATEEAERERERAAQRERVQQEEDGRAAERPRDGDEEQRGERLAAVLRVLAEPAAHAGSA